MQKHPSLLLQLTRLLRLLLHVASGVAQSIIYPFFSLRMQRKMMQRWASGFLSILSIRLHGHGNPPELGTQQVMLAANHVSWLDVCILMAACPTRFVAKSEISRWPILGLLCRNAGTLFIERAKRSDTLRINQQIAAVLKQGECVTVFPEGTTTDGMQIQHFHASLLQSAVTADALLYPVAIGYRNPSGGICLEAAYVEPSLALSLKKILNQPYIDAMLIFNDPIASGMKNRRELARLAEQAIAAALAIPIMHKEVEISHDLPGE